MNSYDVEAHYKIEKELANKIKKSPFCERLQLYSTVYDDLFKLVPCHPQLTRKKTIGDVSSRVSHQLKLINKLNPKSKIILEVGAGDCSLSLALSKNAKYVYAVDVSKIISKNTKLPSNLSLVICNGIEMSIPQEVDIAFSNQLIEHLHPEDAYKQMLTIYDKLKNKGSYICITPNRIFGPHDVSKYFDTIANGLHLKEYSINELYKMFSDSGYRDISYYVCLKGVYIWFPISIALKIDRLLETKRITRSQYIIYRFLEKIFSEIRMVGFKR